MKHFLTDAKKLGYYAPNDLPETKEYYQDDYLNVDIRFKGKLEDIL